MSHGAKKTKETVVAPTVIRDATVRVLNTARIAEAARLALGCDDLPAPLRPLLTASVESYGSLGTRLAFLRE